MGIILTIIFAGIRFWAWKLCYIVISWYY